MDTPVNVKNKKISPKVLINGQQWKLSDPYFERHIVIAFKNVIEATGCNFLFNASSVRKANSTQHLQTKTPGSDH